MKFFIILALVALASADLRRGYGGSSFGLSGGYGSGGYGSGGYGSGGSYGGSYRSGGLSSGFLGGSSGLSSGYGGGYTASGPAQLAIIQTVPGGSSGYSGGGYSSGLGLGGSYGGSSYGSGLSSGVALGGGYGGSYGGSYGGYRGGASYSGGPIFAAVHSTRNVQVVDVGSTGEAAAPASIVIGPSIQPIDIEFQSQSSPVNIRQSHVGGQAAAPQVSSHTEEPDILKQEIVKPVIHEVTEAIQPYRTITQEVRPVLETVNQLITRGEQRQTAVVGRNVGVASSGLGLSGGYSGGYSGRTGYSGSSGLSLGGGYSSGASLGGGKALGLVAIQPISSAGGVVGGAGLSSGLRTSFGGSSLGGGYSSGLSSLGGGYSSGSSLGGGYSSGSSLRSGGSYGSGLVSKPSFSSSFSTDNYRS